MEEDFLKIINYYGLRLQLKKLSEEVYELQEAILMDDSGEEALEHILEERADVEVILRQLDAYFEIKFDDYSMNIVKKVKRTLDRIENKENECK